MHSSNAAVRKAPKFIGKSYTVQDIRSSAVRSSVSSSSFEVGTSLLSLSDSTDPHSIFSSPQSPSSKSAVKSVVNLHDQLTYLVALYKRTHTELFTTSGKLMFINCYFLDIFTSNSILPDVIDRNRSSSKNKKLSKSYSLLCSNNQSHPENKQTTVT